MKSKTPTILTMLFIALLSALVTYCFVAPLHEANITRVQQTIQEEKKQEQAIEKSYAASVKKLQEQNDSLKQVSDADARELKAADVKMSELESNVAKTAVQVAAEPDTAKTKASDCDSLSRATVILIEKEHEKDSLCNITISDLRTEITGKDSLMDDCNESYIQMRQAADSSIARQQQMSNVIKNLNKAVKRKANQSRLLSAGLLVLSGIAATLLLTQPKP